jgi:hypothetical protein
MRTPEVSVEFLEYLSKAFDEYAIDSNTLYSWATQGYFYDPKDHE